MRWGSCPGSSLAGFGPGAQCCSLPFRSWFSSNQQQPRLEPTIFHQWRAVEESESGRIRPPGPPFRPYSADSAVFGLLVFGRIRPYSASWGYVSVRVPQAAEFGLLRLRFGTRTPGGRIRPAGPKRTVAPAGRIRPPGVRVPKRNLRRAEFGRLGYAYRHVTPGGRIRPNSAEYGRIGRIRPKRRPRRPNTAESAEYGRILPKRTVAPAARIRPPGVRVPKRNLIRRPNSAAWGTRTET